MGWGWATTSRLFERERQQQILFASHLQCNGFESNCDSRNFHKNYFTTVASLGSLTSNAKILITSYLLWPCGMARNSLAKLHTFWVECKTCLPSYQPHRSRAHPSVKICDKFDESPEVISCKISETKDDCTSRRNKCPLPCFLDFGTR